MDQNAEYSAHAECAGPFTLPFPPALLAQVPDLLTQMEQALAGIAIYYGRQRLAAYPHEPKAWVDVRAAVLAASNFRQAQKRASCPTESRDPLRTTTGAFAG
jgi:hypothetical protein